ncbi:Aldo/keto reductase [Mycena vulgaris]|nr:Aldo/keto reductase [Mycena vulgaris]
MSSAPSRRMKYVRLSSSGLKVSQIILGCIAYGLSSWKAWTLDEEETINHIKFALLFVPRFADDRTQGYSNGMSEVVLRNAIRALLLPREEILVMIKVRCPLRLCHRFDYETPIAETMQALHDVVKAGYVRYYSLVYREEEREMMPSLKHFGLGSIPWSLLGRGALARPTAKTLDAESKPLREATDDIPAAMYFRLGAGNSGVVDRSWQKKRDVSMAQIALAWLMAKDGVTAPIVGTSSLASLVDLLRAVDVKLTEEEIKYLEEPYEPMNIFMYN